jgi:hypothetical protein
VFHDFQSLTAKEFPKLNPTLKKKRLDPIDVPTEADWQKQHASGGSVSGGSLAELRERD